MLTNNLTVTERKADEIIKVTFIWKWWWLWSFSPIQALWGMVWWIIPGQHFSPLLFIKCVALMCMRRHTSFKGTTWLISSHTHTLASHIFSPRISSQWHNELRWLWQMCPNRLCVGSFPWWVPTLCLGKTVWPLPVCWVKGVYMFISNHNLPPALWAEWPKPVSFTCYCSNTGMEQICTKIKEHRNWESWFRRRKSPHCSSQRQNLWPSRLVSGNPPPSCISTPLSVFDNESCWIVAWYFQCFTM